MCSCRNSFFRSGISIPLCAWRLFEVHRHVVEHSQPSSASISLVLLKSSPLPKPWETPRVKSGPDCLRRSSTVTHGIAQILVCLVFDGSETMQYFFIANRPAPMTEDRVLTSKSSTRSVGTKNHVPRTPDRKAKPKPSPLRIPF